MIELPRPDIHRDFRSIRNRQTSMLRPIITSPVREQVHPEDRVPPNWLKRHPALLMLPISLLPFRDTLRLDVREICLPLGAVIVEKSKEACDPVEQPSV